MLFKALSAAVFGIDAYPVEVEADISAGLPNFTTVGLPDAAVRESRERQVESRMVNACPADSVRRLAVGSGGGHKTCLRKQARARLINPGLVSLARVE
jgi:hypothetical protein